MIPGLFNPTRGADPKAEQEADQLLIKQADSFYSDTWQKVRSAYIVYHMLVWNAFLFYVGQFWITWDKSRKMFFPSEPNDEWTPQPNINRFSPAIDAVASNFSRIPEVEAVAQDTETGADLTNVGVAHIASLVADYIRTQNSFDQGTKGEESLCEEAGQIFALAGTVFTDVRLEDVPIGSKPVMEGQDAFDVMCPQCDQFWPDQPQPLQTCPQCQGPVQVQQSQSQQPKIDPQTEQPEIQTVTEPRIKVTVDSPLEAYYRPGSKSTATTPYLYWARRRLLSEIKRKWDYEADPDHEFADGQNIVQENNLQYFYMGFNGSSMQLEDAALVVELFIEPGMHDDFPGGIYAVYCNGGVRYAKTWPFIEHPKTKASYLRIPSLAFGRTIAGDLVELQREKGSYESLIKLHAMTSAVDPIIMDENTQVHEITGRADKVIKWRSIGPGSKEPHRMQHGVLDNAVYEKLAKFDEEFEHVTGAVGVFRGEQPGSITAASAISDLKSQAELMFNKPVQNWNALWIETTRKAVILAQATFTIPQLVAICGEERIAEIEQFKKADLSTAVNWVASKYGLPRSREDKKQEMMQLFDAGALDLQDPNVKQSIFDLFGEIGLMQQFNADATRARSENQMFKMAGQPDPADPTGRIATPVPDIEPLVGIEDLQTHYTIHAEQIKSLAFDRWAQPAKMGLIQHCLMTKQAMTQEQMTEAAVQGGGPGGPAGPPSVQGPAGAAGKDTHPGNKPNPAGPNSKSAAQRANQRRTT